ncbi:MAG TPA: cation:proton antiporter [Polyangiaceae bacterium]|nr:cation:proton antiporter [Polyangiaceae bacterium]
MTAISSLDFIQWLALIGVLLLALGLSSSHVQRLPISASAVYLVLGWSVGPQGLGWLQLTLDQGNPELERLTEAAVVVALLISGLKLRLPLRHAAWSAVFRLAGPVMLVCIGAIALYAHFVLHLAPALALLLGAMLAPTDPVLAGAVSVSDAADKDRVKYGLSGEAGLNDGTSFPFVVLGLEWLRQQSLGTWVGRWALVEVLWAIPSALVLGYLLGSGVGRLAIRVRSAQRDTEAPSDFVALALIALSYTIAHVIHAWGFLAVFAAGVGLRRAELQIVAESPHPNVRGESKTHPPAEHLVGARVDASDLEAPAVAAGVLVAETISFGNTMERLLELVLVTVVGATVGSYWDWRALGIAFGLFCIVRPLATYALLLGTPTTRVQRWLMGWFGIRGIGSLYYLGYALNHDLTQAGARELTGLTLSVVAISILVHGISATPLLNLYQALHSRRKRAVQQRR